MAGMAFGKGKKGPATATPPKGKSGAKAPGASPLAPPGLAPKMRGMSEMPRMMKKGGRVKGKGC